MDNTNSGTSRLTMIVFLIVALTIIAGAIYDYRGRYFVGDEPAFAGADYD